MTHTPKRYILVGAFLMLCHMAAMGGQLIFNTDSNDPAQAAAKTSLVKGFELANPDVKVQVNIIDSSGYSTNTMRSLQTGNAPDVATAFPGMRLIALTQDKLFEDVTDVWNKSNLNVKQKQAAVSMSTNGKKWGVPWSYYQWGIFYRKDIFEKLKLAPPTTWAELVAACATLSSHKITPFAIGTKETWPIGGWFDYLDMRINGYEFHMNLMSGKVPYTDARVQAVFDKWDELVKPGYFLANHQNYQWHEGVIAFAKGDAAMYLMANFGIPVMKERGLSDAQIGFMQFPEIVKGVPLAEDAPTEAFFIPASAKNKVDARRFLTYLA
jgi:multiple sugar transport system substrate-binding protein